MPLLDSSVQNMIYYKIFESFRDVINEGEKATMINGSPFQASRYYAKEVRQKMLQEKPPIPRGQLQRNLEDVYSQITPEMKWVEFYEKWHELAFQCAKEEKELREGRGK